MFITITININNQKYDIKIDRRRKVIDVLQALKEEGIISYDNQINYLKSVQYEKVVSTNKTFEELEIVEGDCLAFISQDVYI
ncbi:MAG: hypothetical protein ACK5L6_05740 [Anaerorhabdus sp.]|uniref:hypothetical protein n=1 Tax=Anaerorhabdus sp. TaxID=1872524 RepID=UPI003A88F6E4